MNGPLEELPIELQQGDLVTRYAEWGAMAVRFARLPAGADMSPVLVGLPGDRCPSPHWGVVLEGSIHIAHGNGSEEVTQAGQAYYWPEGHTGWTEEGCVFLEIGPVAAMRQFGDHAKAKLG
jgi:hypothetical protein